MEGLSGRNIQVVLSIKEGLGFGFLTHPVTVSVSLNGYTLETDAVMPSHAPIFDSELVWEAEKKQFRNLRLQNVPMKVEVLSFNASGRREKIGYLLLSLLSAQPCPANKSIPVNRIWHKLLGVKAEGKCCHPQLLMSLAVEDRMHNPTPRNELTVFHCNETTQQNVHSTLDLTPVPLKQVNSAEMKAQKFSLEDYYAETQKNITVPELVPTLNVKEGLINIGKDDESSKDIFLLSFTIGSAVNVDMLDDVTKQNSEIETEKNPKKMYHISYTMFAQTVQTDQFPPITSNEEHLSINFNQKTSIRLKTNLSTLSQYFVECPYVIIKLCNNSNDIGICNMDLRKLVPTDNLSDFVSKFSENNCISTAERRFLTCCRTTDLSKDASRKPYVDIEMALKYIPAKEKFVNKEVSLTSRSAGPAMGEVDRCIALDTKKSNSHSDVPHKVGLHTLRADIGRNEFEGNVDSHKNVRDKKNFGQTENDIAEMIKKVLITLSNEKDVLNKNADYRDSVEKKTSSADVCVQCENSLMSSSKALQNIAVECNMAVPVLQRCEGPNTCQSDCHLKEKLKCSITPEERKELFKKMVEELEEWKYRQEKIFETQLKQKEEEYLEVLSFEWTNRRSNLEGQLSQGVEQCRTLATQLNQAAEEFRLRSSYNDERELKLLQAKETLEKHYNSKYEGLREASRQLEAEYQQALQTVQTRCIELQGKVALLEKENQLLEEQMRNEKVELEIVKKSGLTKEQTAKLIEELRSMEDKLENALQSKVFFKEQWGRAVRALHRNKLQNRKYNLMSQHSQLEHGLGLEDMILDAKCILEADQHDIIKLKDNLYKDILQTETDTDKVVLMDTETTIEADVSSFIDRLEMLNSYRYPYQINMDGTELVKTRELLLEDNFHNEKPLKFNHNNGNIIRDE